MKNVKDLSLLVLIRDYLTVYLPQQKNFSDHTVKAYRKALNLFLDYAGRAYGVPLENVTSDILSAGTLQGFNDSMIRDGYSNSTVRQRMMAIHSFLKYAASRNPEFIMYSRDFRTVAIRKEDKHPVEYMSEDAVRAILDQPSADTASGIRDLMIMVMLYDTAARVSELTTIHLCDLNLSGKPSVTLFGKGRKKRIVPLMDNTADQLERYMSIYHPGKNLLSEEFLFFTERKGTRFAMSDDNIRRILIKYSDMAREECPDIPEQVYPHMWRHTRAMHLYQHGMDLMLISQWLGHSDINTTQIYAYADIEKKRTAIASASADILPEGAYAPAFIDDDETIRRLYGLKV